MEGRRTGSVGGHDPKGDAGATLNAGKIRRPSESRDTRRRIWRPLMNINKYQRNLGKNISLGFVANQRRSQDSGIGGERRGASAFFNNKNRKPTEQRIHPHTTTQRFYTNLATGPSTGRDSGLWLPPPCGNANIANSKGRYQGGQPFATRWPLYILINMRRTACFCRLLFSIFNFSRANDAVM